MKKINLKSGAMAAVLAGTMALSMVPATAFATTVSSTQSPNLVTKTWEAASNAQLNDTETFTYDLTFKSSTDQGSNKAQDFSNFGTKQVSVASKWQTNAKGGVSSTANISAAKLFENVDFTAPGTYVFNLKEERPANANPNINYSNAEYDIYVTVSWPENYPTENTPVIQSVKAHKVGSKDEKLDTASFTNSAADNDSLKVSKTVSGTAANTDDTFNYTLSVSGASGNYTVTKSDGTTATLTAGTDYKFTLKHNQNIVVANLPEGATYTVKEGNTDYTESNTVDGVASTNGLEATGTIKKGGDEVAYKNTKGFATDTGVTMNMLPGIGIAVVAVAGGATLVISRRKRAGQDF